ncbi:MAG: GH3 auxin-responsive promoter family protein [Rubricoccaceae bacterium]
MRAARLAYRLWALAALADARRFERALHAPEAAQAAVLREVVRACRGTAYARHAGLDGVRTLADLGALPQATPEALAPWIARIAGGEPHVLTRAPVRLLEPTGGSTGGRRLVPFTAPLQRQFRRAVSAWIVDLLRRDARLGHGPAYWSVSPATGPPERAPGGLPVGFADDGAYLSPIAARLARAVLAVPGALRLVAEPEAFRYATLRLLVGRGDLALVSVWNPTFFELLLASLEAHAEALARDIREGTLLAALPAEAHRAVRPFLRPDPARARALEAALALADGPARYARLWPRLRLVSAWADAHAARPARTLAARLAHAAFQPKGLLATEGVVSVPRAGRTGAALAVTSHVIELVPPGGGEAVPLAEARVGERYAVLLTTAGGLVRYRLGDLVDVVGREGRTPLVRFAGREGLVSDRVGEKLHEAHVRQALEAACAGLEAPFLMLACDDAAAPPAYVLFAETMADDEALREAAAALDRALGANVHYAYARRLGQLGPLGAFRVTGDGHAAYVRACAAQGQRLGDVKPSALHRAGDWTSRLPGQRL